MVSMASSSSSFLHNSLRLSTVENIGYLYTCLHILFSNMVLFSVRSLFLQVSKTWVTDCTSLHSLHKGSQARKIGVSLCQ